MTSKSYPDYKVFEFVGYEWDEANFELKCNYALDAELFTESVKFLFPANQTYDKPAFDEACLGYFLMAGISYFKAGLPPEIKINPQLQARISSNQAKFFEKVYFHGLGELFYENEIKPEIPKFPHNPNYEKLTTNYQPLTKSYIVPLGGGKDSLTTALTLKGKDLKFQTWTVGEYPGLIPSLKELHGQDWAKSHLKVKRVIAPRLIELNQAGAINGHVPISALWGFLSVLTGLLTNQANLLFSNEASANEATLELKGLKINHQYSKTLEFENDFRAYIKKNIHPELNYVSFLRPYSELKIAELFSKIAWPDFKDKFSSCNRNFTQSAEGGFFWCGKCAKCAFVFLILAPFVKPAELLALFQKNLFSDSELNHIWLELLGKTEHKPFECIGTIEEVKQAFILAEKYYPEVAEFADIYQTLPNDYDYEVRHPHNLSKEMEALQK